MNQVIRDYKDSDLWRAVLWSVLSFLIFFGPHGHQVVNPLVLPSLLFKHHACVFLIHQKAIPFQSSWISASAYFHTAVVQAAAQRASTAISLPITAHQGLNPTHLLWMQPMIIEMP